MNIKRIGKAIMVLLLATPALSSMELMAQNLKMPTLEDLLPGGVTYRIAENLPGLQWWGDVCIKPGIDSLFAVNPKNGKETLLTTRKKVNKVLNSLITPTEQTDKHPAIRETKYSISTIPSFHGRTNRICLSNCLRDTSFMISRKMNSSKVCRRPEKETVQTLTIPRKADT